MLVKMGPTSFRASCLIAVVVHVIFFPANISSNHLHDYETSRTARTAGRELKAKTNCLALVSFSSPPSRSAAFGPNLMFKKVRWKKNFPFREKIWIQFQIINLINIFSDIKLRLSSTRWFKHLINLQVLTHLYCFFIAAAHSLPDILCLLDPLGVNQWVHKNKIIKDVHKTQNHLRILLITFCYGFNDASYAAPSFLIDSLASPLPGNQRVLFSLAAPSQLWRTAHQHSPVGLGPYLLMKTPVSPADSTCLPTHLSLHQAKDKMKK